MTGVEELRNTAVVSAAPRTVSVSVLGGRTQLDVNLPAEVPVAALLPELAELISSRDEHAADPRAHDERRTFWQLTTFGGDVLAPDDTLSGAGIGDGEVLLISARRSLSPPTLYDDVVDAAARLNRAAFAAWDSGAARWMAFAGLWAAVAALAYLVVAEPLAPHRAVVTASAICVVIGLVAGAALAHRGFGLADVGTAIGWPAIVLSAAVGWVAAAPHGRVGLAVACGTLLILVAVYSRAVGTGRWGYLYAAVVFGTGAVGALAGVAGAGAQAITALGSVVAVLSALLLAGRTRPANFAPRRLKPAPVRRDRLSLDQLGAAPHASADDVPAETVMPTAEEVWAQARATTVTRSALAGGLATAAAVAALVLMDSDPGWAALTLALVVGVVLGTHSRRPCTAGERAALAVPAVAVVLVACVQAQSGTFAVAATGLGVLAAVAGGGVVAGLASGPAMAKRWSIVLAYLDYVAVVALIPIALWPLGVYDRLGA